MRMPDKQERLLQDVSDTLEAIVKESPQAQIKVELTLDYTENGETRLYNLVADSSKVVEETS